MNVFHVFWIVYIVPNCATHHIWQESKWKLTAHICTIRKSYGFTNEVWRQNYLEISYMSYIHFIYHFLLFLFLFRFIYLSCKCRSDGRYYVYLFYISFYWFYFFLCCFFLFSLLWCYCYCSFYGFIYYDFTSFVIAYAFIYWLILVS